MRSITARVLTLRTRSMVAAVCRVPCSMGSVSAVRRVRMNGSVADLPSMGAQCQRQPLGVGAAG